MTRQERMYAALAAAFSPDRLVIVDESVKHHGHGGARPEGETHYQVEIVTKAFSGKSRVERHRLVNAAIAAEFEKGLHALALQARAPEEA